MSTAANPGRDRPGSAAGPAFVGVMAVAACAALAHAALQFAGWHTWQFAGLLLVGAITSRLKIKLPGMNSNMSVNLPFLLIAMTQLGALEGLIVAAVSVFTQSIPKRPHKFQPVHMLFNVSNALVAVGLGGELFRRGAAWHMNSALSLLSGCALYFFAATVPVAGIISLTESHPLFKIWSDIVHLSFPYYLASTGLASIAASIGGHTTWPMLVGFTLVMFVTYRSYQFCFGMMKSAPAPESARSATAGN